MHPQTLLSRPDAKRGVEWMCRIYLPARREARPFFRYPRGWVKLKWDPAPGMDQPGGPSLMAQAATPSSRLYCPLCPVCPWLIDFRQIHNNITMNPRHFAQNSRLNATKYLFCSVRSFTGLLSPGIIATEVNNHLCRGIAALEVHITIPGAIQPLLFA